MGKGTVFEIALLFATQFFQIFSCFLRKNPQGKAECMEGKKIMKKEQDAILSAINQSEFLLFRN